MVGTDRLKWTVVCIGLMVAASSACDDDGVNSLTNDDIGADVHRDDDANVDVGFDAPPTDAQDSDVQDSDPLVVENVPLAGECVDDSDCEGGTCWSGDEYYNGYCTVEDCSRHRDCGTNGACIDEDDGSFCAPRCIHVSQCRDGQLCTYQPGSSLSACVPGPPPGNAVDGSPCEYDTDCAGGTCIVSADWVDGYCTTLYCTADEDCARESEDIRCLVQTGSNNYCVQTCTETSDCRDGYTCLGLGGSQGYCAPSPYTTIDVDPEDYPFEITCHSVEDTDFSFDYEVAAETVAYMIVPFTNDGSWLYPEGIDLPSGGQINLRGANGFQLTGAQLFGTVNPTVVPAIPRFAGQLESGVHTYRTETESTEICAYILEETTLGTTIDFNVYLVGVDGVTAETAAEDEDMMAVFDQFDAIYASAGIQIGQIRFFDVTGDDEAAFSIIRSERDISGVIALSEPPGDTVDDLLSVNVFFVKTIVLGGAIGISMGLPGPAGLHGTGASGVVFTSEFLGSDLQERSGNVVDGNLFTGLVFAHEVGHYLGLFHTTEQFSQGFDPLADTPECRTDFPEGCDDLTNLMFPFAGVDHVVITEDQGWMIRVSPLTKD